MFNEYHALLVRLGKEICRTKPDCSICPIKNIEKSIEYFCDSCSKELPHPKDRYVLDIKLYASPEIEISESDLKKDSREEIQKLLEETKDMDAKQLEEEVYVSYKLNLCKRCRDILNVRLKNKEFV
ncbi:MAG: hypothetical protein FJZ16_05990 [Candidatus Omnitrophica bacterium]|nr:hypothetical protein [Candidatus Omnitrophota bacterium]